MLSVSLMDEQPGLTKILTSGSEESKWQRPPLPMSPHCTVLLRGHYKLKNLHVSGRHTNGLQVTCDANCPLNNCGHPSNQKLQASHTKLRSSGDQEGERNCI